MAGVGAAMSGDWQTSIVDPVDFTRSVAIGRALAGTGLLLAPNVVGSTWMGPGSVTPATRTALRAMGARDVAIALGTLSASERGEPVVPWVLAGVVADGVDAAATVASFRHLSKRGRWLLLAVAGAGTVAGIWTAGRLSS